MQFSKIFDEFDLNLNMKAQMHEFVKFLEINAIYPN